MLIGGLVITRVEESGMSLQSVGYIHNVVGRSSMTKGFNFIQDTNICSLSTSFTTFLSMAFIPSEYSVFVLFLGVYLVSGFG